MTLTILAHATEASGLANEDIAGTRGRFAWIVDCDGIKVELWQQLGGAPE